MTNRDYKKLKSEWYQKLKDSGFEDIEQDDKYLKYWSTDFKNIPTVNYLAKVSYYQMADNFLNDHRFDSEIDKVIWEYHCNGITVRNIAKLLKNANASKTHYVTIHKVIKALETIMFSKYRVGCVE